MNNKVFYQHPNLMRVLGMHETVMEVMVNVLGGDKSQVSVTTFHSLVSTTQCCKSCYTLALYLVLFYFYCLFYMQVPMFVEGGVCGTQCY